MRNLIYLLLLIPCLTFAQVDDDFFVSYWQANNVCGTAGNIFPTGNAASECGGEADSTSGWSGVQATITSEEGDTQEGTSAIGITSTTTTTSDRGEYTVTVTSGITYDVTYWYKVVQDNGGSSGVISWTGVVTSPNLIFNDDGAWHEVTHTVTTNATSMLMRFYATRTAPTLTGEKILIDHIRVVPQ